MFTRSRTPRKTRGSEGEEERVRRKGIHPKLPAEAPVLGWPCCGRCGWSQPVDNCFPGAVSSMEPRVSHRWAGFEFHRPEQRTMLSTWGILAPPGAVAWEQDSVSPRVMDGSLDLGIVIFWIC